MKKCNENCACKIEGKTHYFNDGCGCPKHNGEEFEHNPEVGKMIGWREEYCKKFGLCKQESSLGKCQYKKELAFISSTSSTIQTEVEKAVKEKEKQFKRIIVTAESLSDALLKINLTSPTRATITKKNF